MAWYNWLIVIVPFLFVIGMAFYSRRYIRDVVDYLSAGPGVRPVCDCSGGVGKRSRTDYSGCLF